MMRRLLILLALSTMVDFGYSQTNTFPSSGNAGVGTTSPSKPLHIYSTAAGTLSRFESTGAFAGIEIKSNTSSPNAYVDIFNNTNDLIGRLQHISNDFSLQNRVQGGSLLFMVKPQSSSSLITAMTIDDVGNLGLGTTTPSSKLDILSGGGNTGTTSALRLRSGNSSTYYGNSQMLLSYNSGTSYSHAIKTRHHSSQIADNAIDFYVWQPSDGVGNAGSKHVLSMNGGNVGIGTTNPVEPLHITDVSGAFTFGRPGTEMNNRFTLDAATGYENQIYFRSRPGRIFTSSGQNLTLGNSVVSNSLVISGVTGHVGIGTTTPSEKLAVNGTIRTKEVLVESSPWPDYVFSNTYNLRSLSEVSSYIEENHHLPGIPTAEEVETNGIKLGEMNAKLLEKIEELTLYVIDLKKENEALKQKDKLFDELIKRIENLESK